VLDPATDSYEISVAATSDGVVTLTGTVDSWPEKQLCQTVAEDVAGVTEVKNEIKVDYATNRPDSEIKPESEQRLHWDVLLNDALIDVGVKNGSVSLSGSVGSAAEKTRATWDAWVAGVKSVDASKLEVVPLARDEDMRTYEDVVRPDDQIQSAVKDAFLYDPRVFSFDVTPTVSSGVVTLEGIVDNAKAKLAAQQDARNTVGVVDVNNRIKVRSETTLPDPTIARNVRRVLMLDPILERYAITVEVVGGVVHLYGDVDTYFDKMRAEALADNSRGVTGVRNHLNVEFQEPYTKSPYIYPYWSYGYPSNTGTATAANSQKSDRQITADIESQLWWDPFIDEDDVDVTVKNGVATFTGTVDNWAEYDAASRSAFEGGASQVINKIEIK
ncbi:MAG: BON domain-containing protein, partial [bacterium]